MLKVISALFLFIAFGVEAQLTTELIKEDTLQRNRVLACEAFTYYGIDFSHFNYVNGKKVGTEEEIKPYIGAWIESVNKKYVFDNGLLFWTDRKAEDNQEEVQRLYLKRENDWVAFKREPLLLDSIQRIVRELPIANSQNEIGLVVIMGAMVKDNESAYVNFVFFDTKTKNILWRLKYRASNANAGGMSGRWATAIRRAYANVFNYWVSETKYYKENTK